VEGHFAQNLRPSRLSAPPFEQRIALRPPAELHRAGALNRQARTESPMKVCRFVSSWHRYRRSKTNFGRVDSLREQDPDPAVIVSHPMDDYFSSH
jgi:hypothetical protein